MANPLKQLAGETAIYGLSTILARVINFLLVPMYTRMLSTQQYGIFTEFMSYIAVLQVVLVLGLETGCFRFANKEGVNAKNVFTTAFNTVLILNIAFIALITVFSGQITSFLGYEGYRNVIIYMAGILVLDNSTAILFSKLRQERKSIKFVIIKSAKILTEMAVNISSSPHLRNNSKALTQAHSCCTLSPLPPTSPTLYSPSSPAAFSVQ